MSQHAEGAAPARPQRDVEIGIFLVGLVGLMLELLHTRMLAFFLGSISSFLAIPVALFGLTLGSLLVHRERKRRVRRLSAILQMLVLPVLTAAFVSFFAVANAFFPVIHVSLENPYGDAARMLVYSGIFLPSYAILGALLALYFDEGAQNIGRLYCFDLAGAASGCVLAPLVLTWAGLPPAIMTVLFAALALLAATPLARRRLAVGAGAAGYCMVAFLACRGSVFQEHPDAERLSRYVMGGYARAGVKEARVRWNDLARTSLMRAETSSPEGHGEAWGIVQDDGLSNVNVARWDPGAKAADMLRFSLHHALPFLMGHEPKRILVLFAGVGRDMVVLDCMAQGRADITGVELNRAVVDLYRDPLLADMNLRAFHARPNIHLAVREGRDFLKNDRARYDLVFVATNGSINAERTGDTRKYLDTYEAMASYLDHLAPGPGSMLVFVNQPVLHKAESLRLLFAERGLGDFGKAVFAFGAPATRGQDSMVVKPGGLTPDEIAAIDGKVASWPSARRVLYSPSGAGVPSFVDAVLGRTHGPLVTDDRPFMHEVSWRDFELLPAKERFIDQLYASSWIKVFTILLFGAVALAVMAFVGLRRDRERRVPWPWVLYFFVAGVSYMCVEIGLIAKTELFLGSPLYAVAVILALFLASNGLGAYLHNRLLPFRGLATLVLPAVVAIAWGVLATHLCNAHLLSMPLPLKILCVALCVAPAGTFLGMFYPFGVEGVVQGGRRAAVPATYAMTTLSSVWGSVWAMTAITNLGFSAVILMGAAGYALTGPLHLVACRLRP
ncbi:MAG TPA: hypothetical protein VFK05_18455 [Polyangiaceae bacterium]|nr:hypothetical protein [Polyangiaceae bacterium]